MATANFDELNKAEKQSISSISSMVEKLSVENETIANTEMKPVYSSQNGVLKKILPLIALIYMEYTSNGKLQPTKSQRISISNKIFNEINSDFENLRQEEAEKVEDILTHIYINAYLKNGDILGNKLNAPSKKDIKEAVRTKIDGKLFSDRIWDNKKKVVRKLKKMLPDILNGKTSIDEAGNEIKNIFAVSASESYRLLITELMRVQAQASINLAKRLGIKRHIWNAKFENTCPHCAELHGKIFDIGDSEAPVIPAHPWCKCIWVNLPN